MAAIWTVVIVAGVILLALALAWAPMQFLVTQMAKNVRELIQRQRERRAVARNTPDRRRT